MDESKVDNGQIEKSNENQESEKQTNKMFTQSEVDQIAYKQAAKVKGDLDKMKAMEAELEQLRSVDKQRKEAEMSEIEKYQKKLQEIETDKIEKEKALFEYKKKDAIDQVLNNGKYSKLPNAYKKLVQYSENTEELITSADDALKEFEQDFGGEVKKTFGVPDQPKDAIKTVRAEIKNADDMSNALKANMAEKLKQRGS
jgi:hypothetical protein